MTFEEWWEAKGFGRLTTYTAADKVLAQVAWSAGAQSAVPEAAEREDPDWMPCPTSRQCHEYNIRVRNQGLEEAAMVCDSRAQVPDDANRCETASVLAARIRDLKWPVCPPQPNSEGKSS